MIQIDISHKDIARVQNLLAEIKPSKRDGVFARGFRAGTNVVLNALKDNLSNRILKTRSARLKQSLGMRMAQDWFGLHSVVGSGVGAGGARVKYANLQETGGTITPKNAKYLTIPLPANLTRAGVMRKSPRELDNAFFNYNSKGNLIMYEVNARGKVTPMFYLTKKATVPGSHYMEKTANQTAEKFVDVLIGEVRKVAERAT